jgi:hypothetical protein
MKRRGILSRDNKKAIEVSMGMMITIVIAVITLILALALVRNLFTGATQSVTSINDKVSSEINKIFADESRKLVIYLGQDKTAKIKAGTTDFSLAIAAQTIANSRINNRSEIQFKFELDESAPKSCIKTIGKALTSSLFQVKLNDWVNANDRIEGPLAGYILRITVPDTTQICSQTVYVTALDKTVDPAGETIASDSFTISILGKGLFG